MLFGRYLPIIAMIAMAGFSCEKKSAPFGLGTLRDDTLTFGFLLLGTVIIVGALLFLPIAAPRSDCRAPWPDSVWRIKLNERLIKKVAQFVAKATHLSLRVVPSL